MCLNRRTSFLLRPASNAIATEFTRDGTPLTFQPNCDYVIGALVEERIARWLACA